MWKETTKSEWIKNTIRTPTGSGPMFGGGSYMEYGENKTPIFRCEIKDSILRFFIFEPTE